MRADALLAIGTGITDRATFRPYAGRLYEQVIVRVYICLSNQPIRAGHMVSYPAAVRQALHCVRGQQCTNGYTAIVYASCRVGTS